MKKIKIAIYCFIIITSVLKVHSQSKKVKKLKKEYIESGILKVNNIVLPIIKWENKDTLKYHIEGELKYMSDKKWNKFLNSIEKLIDIKIVKTEDLDNSDIKIFFGELTKYFNDCNINFPKNIISDKSDSWSNRRYNKKKQLISISYCIVPSKTRDFKRGQFNLKKLFLKSLGLLGEVKSEYSLFYRHETDGNSQFKKRDKRIVKIHYNKAIKAGMTTREVNSTLNELDLEKLLKEKLK